MEYFLFIKIINVFGKLNIFKKLKINILTAWGV
jgi:hypothetical protein